MSSERASSPALRWAGVLLIGVALAAGVGLALAKLLLPAGGDLAAALAAAPLASAAVLAGPVVAALLAAAAASAGSAPGGARVAAAGRPTPAAADRGEAALQLLALLQQEGRLVDFLEEDLSPYPDEQVGTAVRQIHEGCRAALRDRLELVPVIAGGEGATVTVERGFDPAAIRVTGNVHGEPPYRGVLRHPGWRSTALKLPERTRGYDPSILAPAEVEVL